MKKYQSILFSLDGKDFVTDSHNCNSINDVWDDVNDMGSKWFFYPIVCVIKDTDKGHINNQRIIDFCPPFESFKGKSVKNVIKYIKENSEGIAQMF